MFIEKANGTNNGKRILNKNKLAYFINADWYFVLHWLDRAKEARRRGYHVSIIVPSGEKVEQIRSMGFDVFTIPLSRSWGGWAELNSLIKIYTVVLKLKPSIIHSVTIKPNIIGLLVAYVLNIPIVCNISGLGYLYSDNKISTKILKNTIEILYGFFSRMTRSYFLFENKSNLELYKNKKIVFSYNACHIPGAGVDPGLFNYSAITPKEKPVVLFASRMLWSKGVELLISASKRFISSGRHVTFQFAGIIDYENPDGISQDKIETWNKLGYIEWLGERSDIPFLIAQSDIIALPTRYGEGIPRILIEACAVGRPIVSTSTDGCTDIVKEGVNGYTIPIDDYDALYRKLDILLENPSLCQSMGDAGRNIFINNYTNENIFQITFSKYEHLTASAY